MSMTTKARLPGSADKAAVQAWAAEHYDRCHRDDSFSDLARRAPFSKEDRRLMEDWLAAAQRAVRTD